jgi:hypothetical protein
MFNDELAETHAAFRGCSQAFFSDPESFVVLPGQLRRAAAPGRRPKFSST